MRHILAIAIAFGLAATTLADSVIWDQGGSPNYNGWIASSWYSSTLSSGVADDFMVESGPDTITGVQWWGRWDGSSGSADSFNIAIYADDGGKPTGSNLPDPLTTALKVWNVSFADVNETLEDSAKNGYAYEVDLSADPFLCDLNCLYWIEIQAVSPTVEWRWVNDYPQSMWGYSACAGNLDGGWHYWEYSILQDMSFVLTGVPEPGALSLLGLGGLALLRRR